MRPSDWLRLHKAAAAALTLPAADQPVQLSRVVDLGRDVEDSYEQVKALLLREAAAGRDTLDATEIALQRARRVRRIAQSALKAERRLGPWRPVSSTPEGQAATAPGQG